MSKEINIDYLANELELLRSSAEYDFERWQNFENNENEFVTKKLSEFKGFGYQRSYDNEVFYNVVTGSYSNRHPRMIQHYKTDSVKKFFRGLNENFRLPVNHIFVCDRLDEMDNYLRSYDYRGTNPEGFCSRVMFKNEDVLREFLRYVMYGLINKDERLITMLNPLEDGYYILIELVAMLNSDDDERQAKEETKDKLKKSS